ncbi:unnamed protein product, partial [Nesidiocoris tenuis]
MLPLLIESPRARPRLLRVLVSMLKRLTIVFRWLVLLSRTKRSQKQSTNRAWSSWPPNSTASSAWATKPSRSTVSFLRSTIWFSKVLSASLYFHSTSA